MPKGSGEFVPPDKRCKAKSKQTGEPCGQFKVPGMEVCHYHGGATPGGIGAGNFKHGRYSRYLPARLLERYEEALKDREALAQREEIALLESRIKDLMQRTESGESGSLMKELRGHVNEYKKAQRLHNEDQRRSAMAEALAELFSKIDAAHGDYRIWDEITKLVQQTVRVRESERRYILEQKEAYSADEVRTMLAAVGDIIKRNVREQAVVQTVAREIAKLEHVDVPSGRTGNDPSTS